MKNLKKLGLNGVNFSYKRVLSAFHKGSIFLHLTKHVV